MSQSSQEEMGCMNPEDRAGAAAAASSGVPLACDSCAVRGT